MPRGENFFFKPTRRATSANAFFKEDSERKRPSFLGKRRSDASCSAVTSIVSTCQRSTSITCGGRLTFHQHLVPDHMNLIHPQHPPAGVPATRKPGGSISERPKGQFLGGAIITSASSKAEHFLSQSRGSDTQEERRGRSLQRSEGRDQRSHRGADSSSPSSSGESVGTIGPFAPSVPGCDCRATREGPSWRHESCSWFRRVTLRWRSLKPPACLDASSTVASVPT